MKFAVAAIKRSKQRIARLQAACGRRRHAAVTQANSCGEASRLGFTAPEGDCSTGWKSVSYIRLAVLAGGLCTGRDHVYRLGVRGLAGTQGAALTSSRPAAKLCAT